MAFTENFRKRTLERMNAGLPPLDWCAEIYEARPSWYANDGSCANGPEATNLRKL